jgi:hypothetical protein
LRKRGVRLGWRGARLSAKMLGGVLKDVWGG